LASYTHNSSKLRSMGWNKNLYNFCLQISNKTKLLSSRLKSKTLKDIISQQKLQD